MVVVYHWSNFFYDRRSEFHGDPQQLPLYPILWPVYEQGLMAVDLFFCLSGFIFFWLYSRRIAEQRVSFKQFGCLRFSRLYPLHFVTLLLAAAATYAIRHLDGSYWGDSGYNDWHHFILQIFFISNWGWEQGFSFNGPIWSVSVEVWLYLMFFCLCRLKLTHWKLLLGYGAVGLMFTENGAFAVGKGILGFFMGGLAFKLFDKIQNENRRVQIKFIVPALIAMWIFFPMNFQMNLVYRALCHVTTSPNDYGIGGTIVFFTTYSYDFLLFPATIILLALWETQRGTLGKRLSFLGDISYSSYLLHFPMQLGIIILAIKCGWSKTLFSNPAIMLAFFLVLIATSLASHRWFEKPAQHWLRKKLLPPDRPA